MGLQKYQMRVNDGRMACNRISIDIKVPISCYNWVLIQDVSVVLNQELITQPKFPGGFPYGILLRDSPQGLPQGIFAKQSEITPKGRQTYSIRQFIEVFMTRKQRHHIRRCLGIVVNVLCLNVQRCASTVHVPPLTYSV